MSEDPRVIGTEEDRAAADGAYESPFGWEWRAVAVSAFWAVPDLLLGVLARVCVPDGGPVTWWMAGGSVLGATFGGLLEADHLSL